MQCVLLGAGGHAAVLIGELQRAQPALELVLLDQDPRLHGSTLLSCPIVGDDSQLGRLAQSWVEYFVVAFGGTGDNTPRRAAFERAIALGFKPLTVQSSSALVSQHAQIATGAQLLPGCIVNARAHVGANAIVNSGSLVEHDCVIEDHAHVASGAVLCGAVHVGLGAHIGAGAVVKQGVRIGAAAVVGAGAVVVSEVPEKAVVVGVPAKLLRQA